MTKCKTLGLRKVHDARIHAPNTYHKRDGEGQCDGGDGNASVKRRDLVKGEGKIAKVLGERERVRV